MTSRRRALPPTRYVIVIAIAATAWSCASDPIGADPIDASADGGAAPTSPVTIDAPQGNIEVTAIRKDGTRWLQRVWMCSVGAAECPPPRYASFDTSFTAGSRGITVLIDHYYMGDGTEAWFPSSMRVTTTEHGAVIESEDSSTVVLPDWQDCVVTLSW